MTEMQAIAAIVLSFAVPFAVQLIKTEAMTGKAARILALGCSPFVMGLTECAVQLTYNISIAQYGDM